MCMYTYIDNMHPHILTKQSETLTWYVRGMCAGRGRTPSGWGVWALGWGTVTRRTRSRSRYCCCLPFLLSCYCIPISLHCFVTTVFTTLFTTVFTTVFG